jgi:hypothetical protein
MWLIPNDADAVDAVAVDDDAENADSADSDGKHPENENADSDSHGNDVADKAEACHVDGDNCCRCADRDDDGDSRCDCFGDGDDGGDVELFFLAKTKKKMTDVIAVMSILSSAFPAAAAADNTFDDG